MPTINVTAVLQTVPLLGGLILVIIYAQRCRSEKRKFDYETVFLCFADCIALTSAILLILAAYFEDLRKHISDLGIYIAISGVVVAHMTWTSLSKRIFFQGHGKLTEENDEIESIYSSRAAAMPFSIIGQHDLLILVDIQRDFCRGGALETPDADSLISPINDLVRAANADGCVIVLSRDWHPADHKSFEGNGGRWPPHCVKDTNGAQFHPELAITTGMQVVDIGSNNVAPDYSAFDDPRLAQLIESYHVRTIYIAGIALEYCVLATCLDALKYGTAVVALEPYIRAATSDPEKLEEHWQRLMDAGIIRAKNYAPRPVKRG